MKSLLTLLLVALLGFLAFRWWTDQQANSSSPSTPAPATSASATPPPALHTLLSPVQKEIFGEKNHPNVKRIMAAKPDIDKARQAITQRPSSQATQSALRLCNLMDQVIAMTEETAGRIEKTISRPSGSALSTPAPSNAGNATTPDPTRNIFARSSVIQWRERYFKIQATAAQEWMRLVSLENGTSPRDSSTPRRPLR